MKYPDEMDYQNCNYAKLDSMDMDPETTKREDGYKVLIDVQTPLIDKNFTYPNTNVKKIKKKKRVLSTLDILISIFIVTPCVVGCWRGIWQIMDIYAVYFPPWESFIIGTATHMVLALGQDVFHHVVVEQEKKNPILRFLALFLMKFYIVTFNVITNLIWRGAWILFDRYCNLQSSDTGIALWEGSSTAIWFTIICTLIIFCMKGLKNTMSPPFSIALDSEDEIFLFRTSYIYKATYFGVVLFINKNPILVAAEVPTAEKLISPESLQIETHQKLPPRPFGINILGPPPHEFTPSTTTAVPTTMRAPSMNYPQLTNYRHNYQPKNIQEILGYINQQRSYDVDVQENQNTERQSTNIEGFHRQSGNSSSGFTSTDPFYLYKPTDPSDINLLATASFRFAPPVWKNFRKLYYQQTQQQSKPIPPSTVQQVDTSNIQETFRNFAKPFVVTLNIVPMEDQYPSAAFNRYGQVVYPHSGNSHQKYYGSSRARLIGNKGNKMTIRLNVFPESMTPFSGGQQEKPTAESTLNKVKFL